MPFITDHSWTPTRYRLALAAWSSNAETRESDILPRQAAPTDKPRHDKLAGDLKNLLTWRALTRGEDWTALAANDNKAEERPAPVLFDSILEQRPTRAEIFRAVKDVEFATRRHAKLGGGGADNIVPIGGDIERGKVCGQRPREIPECVVRLGLLRFSNGATEEPSLVLQEGKAVRGAVRIELGGLIRIGEHKPMDRFRGAKGEPANDNTPRVGNANPGAIDFVDPVAEVQHGIWIRKTVGADTAAVLDLALVAANFTEIGEYFGAGGKTAERRGKREVLKACAVLDEALAA